MKAEDLKEHLLKAVGPNYEEALKFASSSAVDSQGKAYWLGKAEAYEGIIELLNSMDITL